jgi:hypothetical protein
MVAAGEITQAEADKLIAKAKKNKQRSLLKK